jgi:hypothetical protein
MDSGREGGGPLTPAFRWREKRYAAKTKTVAHGGRAGLWYQHTRGQPRLHWIIDHAKSHHLALEPVAGTAQKLERNLTYARDEAVNSDPRSPASSTSEVVVNLFYVAIEVPGFTRRDLTP